MRLDKLLKDMEKERETNYKNISYNNIVNYLDKTSHSAPQGGTLNALLENINKTFSDIKLGNLSTPPPIRDPSWRIRSRRRSMYSTAPLPLALPPPPPPPPPPLKKINIQVEINPFSKSFTVSFFSPFYLFQRYDDYVLFLKKKERKKTYCEGFRKKDLFLLEYLFF